MSDEAWSKRLQDHTEGLVQAWLREDPPESADVAHWPPCPGPRPARRVIGPHARTGATLTELTCQWPGCGASALYIGAKREAEWLDLLGPEEASRRLGVTREAVRARVRTTNAAAMAATPAPADDPTPEAPRPCDDPAVQALVALYRRAGAPARPGGRRRRVTRPMMAATDNVSESAIRRRLERANVTLADVQECAES